MDEMLKRLMDKLRAANEKRSQLLEARKSIVEVAKVDGREDLTDSEDAEFRAKTAEIEELDGEITKLDERIKQLAEEEERNRKVAQAQRRAKAVDAQLRVNEARTYERGNGFSYLRDLGKLALGDEEARCRLVRHAEEVRVEPEYQEYRDLSRADGSGGYFVPPAWLMGQWIGLARASRATANLIVTQPLPPGTDSINIPRVLTGTRTDIQPADNDPVVEQDLTDSSLSVPVRTIAGQQDVAQQLLDQSPINFDEVVFRDLLADYALRTNLQVISGSGAAGQVTGIMTQTGVTAVTLTATTVAGAYAAIANAVQQVHTSRFQSPNVIVMHPRRWAWFTAQLDANSRPLVVPVANGPQNAVGTFTGVAQQQVVGTIMGLPVVTDPSLPTNRGTGTNEDVILVLRTDDLLLYESPIRTRVMLETLSGTLTVRLQVYGYIAFSAGRYPVSVARITGAGLVSPTF